MTTIGVSIALPADAARQLEDYRARIGDPTARMIPSHITLVPPTETDDDQIPGITAHLAGAAATQRPFRVHLRGTGTFRPVSPVVFVAVAEGISGCEQLAAAVRHGPLDVALSFPYHPHVTVAHHLGEETLDRAFDELADFDCAFEVVDFHLYLHEEATGWRPAHTFVLGD